MPEFLDMSLVLRTADGGDPLALAPPAWGLVRDMIPSAAIARVRTLEDVVGATFALRRFTFRLLQEGALLARWMRTLLYEVSIVDIPDAGGCARAANR